MAHMFNGPSPWQVHTAHFQPNPGGYENNQSNYDSRRNFSAPRFNFRNSVGSNRGSFNQMQSNKPEPRQLWPPNSPITSPQPKFSRLDYNGINVHPLNHFQPTYDDYSHGFNGRINQQPVSRFETSNMRGIPRWPNQVGRGRGSRNVPTPNGESAGTFRNRKQSNRPSSASSELSSTQLKILEILNKQPQGIAEFNLIRIEIMRVDGLKKKEINHAIYDLDSRRFVKKIQNQPPIWQAITGNDSVYSAASSMQASLYGDNNVSRTNVNSGVSNSNNFMTESLVSDKSNEGHWLTSIGGITSENLGDSSNVYTHSAYPSNSTCTIVQNSNPGLDRTVQEGHQSVRTGLGRGRAMSLFKKASLNDSDWVGDYHSTNTSETYRAGEPSERVSSAANLEPNNCISKRLQELSELPISQYDTMNKCQISSRQQVLTDESQFDDSFEDFTRGGNASSSVNESVACPEQIGGSSLHYNTTGVNSSSGNPYYPDQVQMGDCQSVSTDNSVGATVGISSQSVTVAASKAPDVSRSKLLTVLGSQSSGGFKVPLPPKQLLMVDPKFQATHQTVRNVDHSSTKLNTTTTPFVNTTPTIALRETVCEPTCSISRVSASGNEFHSLPANEFHSLPASFGSLNVKEDPIYWDGIPMPSEGLQRCTSLQDGSRKKPKNPFAVALHLEDDEEDDDISYDAPSSNVMSYSREPCSSSLPRSMSYDHIMSLEGSSIVSASHSGRSASCSSTDSRNQRGGILTSLVGFGGACGTSGPSVTGESFAALNKNCISALMEYAQARKMEATIECIDSHGPSHKPKFKMAVFMGGRWFPYIVCTNKKEGKKEAADVALRTLMSEGSYQSSQTSALPFENLGQKATHFDHIASLAHQTFNRLAATVMESMVGKKVLGAFIMTTGPNDPGTVISIGTGNRCITGTFLSLEGQTVNDSHAEVISRRGLIRFLYRQLLSYTPGHSSTIFELSPSGKLKVKDDIKFHLYISTAPCGDGALFSPRDIGSVTCPETGCHTPTFANKLQGKLRTKMEGGEGTIPIDDQGGAQCWDGILRGERLRTMSCSDKVCRWNIVGLQGALLSHFIEPVYMASLTLGFLYDHGHLSRAVCCRLSNGEPDISSKLPQGYRINHPLLGRVTAYDPTREVQKTKELSVNWVHGDESVELTDGTKGICVSAAKNGQTSQVAKCSLFEQYHSVCQRFNRTDLMQHHTYRHAKHQAVDFRTVNQLMCEKFKKLGHGRWVTKPVEEEMFSWSGAV